MVPMAASVFVDTNVLLRFILSGLKDPRDEQRCKDQLNRYFGMGTELWISGQVIREFCVQATRRGKKQFLEVPLTSQQVVHRVVSFPKLFQIADETPAVREKFIELLDNHKVPSKQIHDANIAATMIVNDISTLCTLNRKDFNRYRRKGLFEIEAPQANPA